MLTMVASQSAEGAKRYYTEALSQADYYTEGQEVPGRWHGRLAASFGLAGEQVTSEAFAALCENRRPDTGGRLTARTGSNRRVGYDCTFSAPKSVSTLYALLGDERIAEAVREAANHAIRTMEAEMKTRVRRGGRDEDRTTGSMLWSDFLHKTSRPVDGVPDPQLHVHCYAMNVTWDSEEGRFKAGQFGDLKRDAAYFEGVFHARLAEGIAALGYPVTTDGRYMQVAGMPASLTRKFSRRTAAIEAAAERLGITSEKAKALLGARTRNQKDQSGLTLADIREWWQAQPSAEEWAAVRAIANGGSGSVPPAPPMTPAAAIQHALDHVLERLSVATDKQLLTEALRVSFGRCCLTALQRALQGAPIIAREVDGQTMITTPEVASEELAMLRLARTGRATRSVLGPTEWTVDPSLNRGQAAAVAYILSCRDEVMLVRGGAGTGKTTLMKDAVAGIRAGGHEVYAFAPTAAASRGVLREEGFAGADTVAALLRDPAWKARIQGQVVLVDEAGLLGIKDLYGLMQLAREATARLVLVGDSRQHSAVARGDALRVLETEAGYRPAEVTDILRQRGNYREAVAEVAKGRVKEGLSLLDRQGWIILEPDDKKRYHALVDDYLDAVLAGKSALALAPTHREGRVVSALIREGLKEMGVLDKEEHAYVTHRNLNWTEAQRAQAALYEPGLVLRFHGKAASVAAGETLTVTGRQADGTPLTRRADGSTCPVPLGQPGQFSVCKQEALPLAAGERVRITRNGTSCDGHRLNNGAVYEVKELTPRGEVLLTNGWRIGPEFGGLEHGYVSTSHSAQGRTVDRVFIAEHSESGRAASREQLYVSLSRGREMAKLYTDSRAALENFADQSGARRSALDLLRMAVRGQKPPEHPEERKRYDLMKLVQQLQLDSRSGAGGGIAGNLRARWQQLHQQQERHGPDLSH